MINHLSIGGNLTRDPEIRFLAGERCVAAFTVAANHRWKDAQGEQREETVFLDCEAWGRTAEVIGQHFQKGASILVEGRIKQSTWDDKETGKKRSKISLVVERFHFIGSKAERPAQAQSQTSEADDAPPPETTVTTTKRSQSDDEPPF